MLPDPDAVRALIFRYADLIDAGDLDGLAALFAHATWRSAGRDEVLRGTAEVRRAYEYRQMHGHPQSVPVRAVQSSASSKRPSSRSI